MLAQVNNLSNVSKIATGNYHTLILKEDYTVWGLGSNSSGQLGIGYSITQTKGSDGLGYLKLFQPPLTVCSSNCDYTSLQLAIESASLTDKIVVSDGTYVENINFKGKNITIQSINGPEKTILQTNSSSNVITFNSLEQNSAILKGFTIKGGSSTNGGGIYISGASPIISECIISNNNADNKGGGVYCENASPKFINCIFHNNTAETGHALYLFRSSPEIINCTISKNGYPIGEGIVIYDAVSAPVIINSILWNNGDEIILQNSATVTVEYSNIEGGTPGTGNIQADPLFIDIDQNNYHLLPASPCLNAATSVNAPTIDIDYQTRPIDNQIDIGADETSNNTKPIADFTTNILTGMEPLDISIQNLTSSQEGIVINIWSFGDGITSTVENPSHTYTQHGNFIVSLTIYEEDGDTDIKSLTISVQDSDPIANFTTNQTAGLEPFGITFTNQSISYDGIKTIWNFGDGITSTVENPTHSYIQHGNFNVSLTVYEEDGDTDIKSLTISVQDSDPTANFTTNQTSGLEPLDITFTNQSASYDGMKTFWSFGDGITSAVESPIHSYTQQGTFIVNLTVYEEDGDTDTKSLTISVQDSYPTANFSTNQTTGIEPLDITFTNQSTSHDGIETIWNFGDGITSTVQNPIHSYTRQGIFTVSLTVFEEDGDTDTKSLTISVQDSDPTANFSTNHTTGLEPLEIQFTNQSISYDGIETIWNFGDGITSTVQNPTHSYTQQGIFTVSLTVYEKDGDTDTSSLTITVLDTDPIANFSANKTTGFAPLNVQFTNLSTSYDGFESHWNFGDGTTSNELKPLHAFSSGDYTVTLTVTEPDSDTSTKMISAMIQVYAIREICASGCDYTAIQMAVNDSRSGDRISVKPGTYYDTLDFQSKAIRIESTHGSNVTTIDAGNSGSVVRFAHQETNNSILKGFTLKNGLSDFGGGIFADNASPVIENCRIIHNQAGSGGGLYLTNGALPKLSNCSIDDNMASNGGGVFIDNSNIHFSQTTIKFNIAAQNGGGMYLNNSSPDMDRIIIQGNHAARGAGIYITQNSLPQITRSQLSENSASETGGGAFVMQQSTLNIVNSLIFGNSANFDGGGFYVKDAELQIHSSSLVHQYASFGRSVFADAATLTISNSILWNNGEEIEDYDSHIAVDHSDIQLDDGIFQGEGNINEDPNFRDPLSDFRLNSTSPCIDAGTTINAPTNDLSGKIRPSGIAPDIGAYEWNNSEPSASFYAINTTVYAGIAVEFRDRSYSYDGIQTWQWDFADGTEDDSQHPIHTYENPGIYTVKLTIYEPDGDSDTFTRYGYITIKGEEPTADFYANPRTGFGSLEVQFTDRSVSPQSEIVKWLWEFGDGQSSTEKNPLHHYTTHGTYSVKLTVTNTADAEHSTGKNNYIRIQDTQPQAKFRGYPRYGQKALTVRFYNQSTSFYDITDWHWDFGDGETSAESNPTHTYTHSGYYSVTLEVISAGGTSETFRNNYIHVFESVETFYVNVSGGQDQYTSIQSAIDVSNMGDTIIVAPGTYYETIDYKGKGITIKSSQGAEKTIIDANNIDAAVKCINGEDSGAVLRGFSVTNGFAMNGGGIYISGASSPTIIDCIVFNNQAQKEGGGIAAAYSSMPMIL